MLTITTSDTVLTPVFQQYLAFEGSKFEAGAFYGQLFGFLKELAQAKTELEEVMCTVCVRVQCMCVGYVRAEVHFKKLLFLVCALVLACLGTS